MHTHTHTHLISSDLVSESSEPHIDKLPPIHYTQLPPLKPPRLEIGTPTSRTLILPHPVGSEPIPLGLLHAGAIQHITQRIPAARRRHLHILIPAPSLVACEAPQPHYTATAPLPDHASSHEAVASDSRVNALVEEAGSDGDGWGRGGAECLVDDLQGVRRQRYVLARSAGYGYLLADAGHDGTNEAEGHVDRVEDDLLWEGGGHVPAVGLHDVPLPAAPLGAILYMHLF
mmetsp:Transcript_14777/g.42478  ORF Transcript_14777/g.42478 Transcript_14777/m.42478 type:complete len:230 (-) Transcript_14777:977-1666(-)